VEVSRLPKDVLVEIDCIAVIWFDLNWETRFFQ
jgi:hypothetical protein